MQYVTFICIFPLINELSTFHISQPCCISSVIAFAHFVKLVSFSYSVICKDFVLDMIIVTFVAHVCSWSICCLLALFMMSLFIWKTSVYVLILFPMDVMLESHFVNL